MARSEPPSARSPMSQATDSRILAGVALGLAQVVVGALLVAAGVGMWLGADDGVGTRRALVAAAAVCAGLALVAGPWWWRLSHDLASERRERIRAQERDEVAAHIHDSVLQTLTLIQRNCADPKAVATLARQQERELRTWLYGGEAPPDESLAAAVQRMSDEVEDMHGVKVETVAVGDRPIDQRLIALVQSTREALANAARHSGASSVSAYVEVESDQVTVYVRDRGCGFDPDRVPDDRRGISESIIGRMNRYGGKATITSSPGEGTEVELVMPL
ncbi:MAG: sensor histidine kinase [Acidimicrobiia bacterium]